MKKKLPKGEIVIYKTSKNEVALKVKLQKDTVWLSLDQLATLFGRDKSVVSRHLKNIFKEKELTRKSVVAKFATTATDGKIYNVDYYNLDIIISLGYRVKSQNGVKFRIWATNILKKYIIQDYVINKNKLLKAQNKFHELQKVVLFLQNESKKELLAGQESEILNLLADYSKTLSLLDQYDKEKLADKKGPKAKFVLKYKNCSEIIAKLKKELLIKKEAADLFGHNGKRKINDNALTALALLVAESSPKDKNIMVKLIKNLISN